MVEGLQSLRSEEGQIVLYCRGWWLAGWFVDKMEHRFINSSLYFIHYYHHPRSAAAANTSRELFEGNPDGEETWEMGGPLPTEDMIEATVTVEAEGDS